VETLSDYRLGSGDQIRITVYDEPDLSMEVRLSDTGSISYPFLGEIQVLGRSVAELEKRIRDGLRGDYLVEPEVSISILEYRPFFIHGEVEAPGGFAYVPGITLRKAIALAGGFTERASRRKIQVIRDGVASGARAIGLDEELQPGDIITVEQSFF
ncbi:MAG: polysaccharide biosynthesis/export family protein, partial [Pseudomonadales bacterium]